MYSLSLLCFVLALNFSGYTVEGGGGKGTKHELIKIHVPEIIKHNHHTHYVYIHKHHKAPKKAPPKKKVVKHQHKHKHIHKHIPGHHHHKHWHHKTHKHVTTHGGHGHGGHKGHGHKPMVHKHVPKPHKHGHKVHKHGHKTKKEHGHKKHHKKHHDTYQFTSDEAGFGPTGYQVTEDNYDDEYDNVDQFDSDDYTIPGDTGYQQDDSDYFSYPSYGYVNAALTSYDISPYYGASIEGDYSASTNKNQNGGGGNDGEAKIGDTNGKDYEFDYDPENIKEYAFKSTKTFGEPPNEDGKGKSDDDSFGESIPGYKESLVKFLSNVHHNTFDDTSIDKEEDGSNGSRGHSYGFEHSFGHGKEFSSKY